MGTPTPKGTMTQPRPEKPVLMLWRLRFVQPQQAFDRAHPGAGRPRCSSGQGRRRDRKAPRANRKHLVLGGHAAMAPRPAVERGISSETRKWGSGGVPHTQHIHKLAEAGLEKILKRILLQGLPAINPGQATRGAALGSPKRPEFRPIWRRSSLAGQPCRRRLRRGPGNGSLPRC